MLHHRQLIGIVAGIVEHLLHERRSRLGGEQPQRPLDRFAALVARQPRHEVLAPVERLGEPGELRAAARNSDRIVTTT